MILHSLLAAIEILQLQVVLSAVDQRLGGGQTHDLGADDVSAVALRQSLDHLVDDEQLGALIVDHVHGDLSDTAVLQHEAGGLAVLETAGGSTDDLGDVLGDLNKRRGRVLGMTPTEKRGEQVIEAEAPMSEMVDFAVKLRAITQGKGTYTLYFSDYEEVPMINAQKIIEEAKKNND